ncbi:hypothetical protein [Photorhabdus heterorhabditis]|uniref:hypothetical protein n=1 Tax=Photorhabdus heterorhabditis TaxID=880156 RepID=UPI0030D7E203
MVMASAVSILGLGFTDSGFDSAALEMLDNLERSFREIFIACRNCLVLLPIFVQVFLSGFLLNRRD